MNEINDISWGQFMIYAVVLILIMLGYRMLVKNMIERRLTLEKDKRLDTRFVLFNRVFYLLFCLILAVLFVRINPLLHSIILLIFVGTIFSYLSNCLMGIFLIYDQKLKPGMEISLDENKMARISRLGLTDVTTNIDNRIERIPYTLLAKRVSYSSTGNETYLLILECSPSEKNEQFEQSLEKAKKQLFMSPYLSGKESIEYNIIENKKADFMISILSKSHSSLVREVLLRNEIITIIK